MSFTILAILYILFLVVYWFFISAVLWHFKEYSLPHSYATWVVRGFLVAAIFLNIFSAILLYSLRG